MNVVGKSLSKFLILWIYCLILILSSESKDDNGNFTCSVELPDGTKGKGTGKRKKLAQQRACNIVKK